MSSLIDSKSILDDWSASDMSRLPSGLGERGGVCSARDESTACDFFCRLLECESVDSEPEMRGDIEDVDEDICVESLLLFAEAAAAAAAAARAACVMGM